jgi:hypothetical protein
MGMIVNPNQSDCWKDSYTDSSFRRKPRAEQNKGLNSRKAPHKGAFLFGSFAG